MDGTQGLQLSTGFISNTPWWRVISELKYIESDGVTQQAANYFQGFS